MGSINRFWVLIPVFILASCVEEEDCPYNGVQISISTAERPRNEGTQFNFYWENCLNGAEDGTLSRPDQIKYFSQIYLEQSALAAGDPQMDVYRYFEQGTQLYENAQGATEQQRNLVEIRNKTTLYSNIGNPLPDLSDLSSVTAVPTLIPQEDGSFVQGTFRVLYLFYFTRLHSHPAYIYLALESVDDPGGSKRWSYESVTKLDGSPLKPEQAAKWECTLDNELAFMKGNRLRYDPNGPNNDGPLCPDEEDYIADLGSIEKLYGQYQIIEENNKAYLRLYTNNSIDGNVIQGFDRKYEIVSVNFTELKVIVPSEDGTEFALATLRAGETINEVANF